MTHCLAATSHKFSKSRQYAVMYPKLSISPRHRCNQGLDPTIVKAAGLRIIRKVLTWASWPSAT